MRTCARPWLRWAVPVVLFALTACAGGPPAPRQAAAEPPPAFAERLDLGQGLVLRVEARSFEPSRHQIVFCEGNVPCAIDGAPVYGTEGGMPRLQVSRILLTTPGGDIALDHRGMYNPWSPREGQRLSAAVVARDEDELRVRGEFSDGSAAYVAEWRIVRGAAIRTLIDCIECLAQTCDQVNPRR